MQQRYRTYCNQRANRGSLSFKDVFAPIALETWMRRFESHLRLD